jgi:hypothetical protein
MFRRTLLILVTFTVFALVNISCAEDEPPPVNTSVGGAVLETGLAVDENLVITDPGINFKSNEEFYFYFHNNEPFNAELVVVQLIESKSDRILAGNEYPVDPETSSITDMIWFGGTGKYKIVIYVAGQIRATREVIIE